MGVKEKSMEEAERQLQNIEDNMKKYAE